MQTIQPKQAPTARPVEEPRQNHARPLPIESAAELLRGETLRYAREEMEEQSPDASALYGAALEFAASKLARQIAQMILQQQLGRDDVDTPVLDDVADAAGRAGLRYLLYEARNR